MLIVLWDSFLMKKLLKSEVCGSHVHCSRENWSITTAEKKIKNKKKSWKRVEEPNVDADVYPNRYYMWVWIHIWVLCLRFFFFFLLHTFHKEQNSLFTYYLTLFRYYSCTVHGTHSHFIQNIYILKMGLTVLFTYLKIILL